MPQQKLATSLKLSVSCSILSTSSKLATQFAVAPDLLECASFMLALLQEMGADDGYCGEKLKAVIAKMKDLS